MTLNAPGRILIVDDELNVRFFVEKALKRDGHQVVSVASGEEALKHVTAEQFDLALIDLRLKDMSGLEVLAALRRHWPRTPAIILTAHASLETAVEALRQGAHDYLFKPCTTVDLRESVRTGLLKRQQLQQSDQPVDIAPGAIEHVGDAPLGSEAHPAAPPASSSDEGRFLQHNDLIVDPIRHVITLDGKLLELSPTEFALLAFLVSEAPRVVSAQELQREVQGYDGTMWEARDIVRSHIYHIRQKTKLAANRDVIRTVRGIGYAISE